MQVVYPLATAATVLIIGVSADTTLGIANATSESTNVSKSSVAR